MKYRIEVREEGRGKPTIRKFATLAELQTYVRDRWQGVDYIDDVASFHSDYATFDIVGATLADLGERVEHGTELFWDWTWKDFASEKVNPRPNARRGLSALGCPACGRSLRYCVCATAIEGSK